MDDKLPAKTATFMSLKNSYVYGKMVRNSLIFSWSSLISTADTYNVVNGSSMHGRDAG